MDENKPVVKKTFEFEQREASFNSALFVTSDSQMFDAIIGTRNFCFKRISFPKFKVPI